MGEFLVAHPLIAQLSFAVGGFITGACDIWIFDRRAIAGFWWCWVALAVFSTGAAAASAGMLYGVIGGLVAVIYTVSCVAMFRAHTPDENGKA